MMIKKFELLTYYGEYYPDFYIDVLTINDRSLFKIYRTIDYDSDTNKYRIEFDFLWCHLPDCHYNRSK